MNEREQQAYEEGRAAGYDEGARGHLPASSIVIVLPEGFEGRHEDIFQRVMQVVHDMTEDKAQVFRLDDLVQKSAAGVR